VSNPTSAPLTRSRLPAQRQFALSACRFLSSPLPSRAQQRSRVILRGAALLGAPAAAAAAAAGILAASTGREGAPGSIRLCE